MRSKEDEEEKEDVNLAKKPLRRMTAPPIPLANLAFLFSRVSSGSRELRFYPDLVEGQQIKVEILIKVSSGPSCNNRGCLVEESLNPKTQTCLVSAAGLPQLRRALGLHPALHVRCRGVPRAGVERGTRLLSAAPQPGQDDGNYDIKFHDQLLGEKNGMPIEVGGLHGASGQRR